MTKILVVSADAKVSLRNGNVFYAQVFDPKAGLLYINNEKEFHEKVLDPIAAQMEEQFGDVVSDVEFLRTSPYHDQAYKLCLASRFSHRGGGQWYPASVMGTRSDIYLTFVEQPGQAMQGGPLHLPNMFSLEKHVTDLDSFIKLVLEPLRTRMTAGYEGRVIKTVTVHVESQWAKIVERFSNRQFHYLGNGNWAVEK